MSPPEGALSKFAYKEVSPIFLPLNISKSDIFGSKLTETKGIMFLGINIVKLIFLGSLEAILDSIYIVSGLLCLFRGVKVSKLADIFGLRENFSD